mgnify:CR=1 FL=1|jgi:hypothetical protein
MSAETIKLTAEESLATSFEAARKLEISEAEVDARFAAIVAAEENLAAGDDAERERRTRVTSYKPSQGFDINSLKAAG